MSLLQQLTRKKLPTESVAKDLTKCLTAFDLTLLGIGAIIGTGIFVLTGHAAATQAGPAVVISFVVAGIACAFAALAYSELAASVGGTGSAYGYSYAAFGELIAWIIGWDLVLEYAVSVEAVANGWSGYFKDGLASVGLTIPDLLTKGPIDGGLINLPAAGIILALMALLIIGTKESTRFNAAMVCVKLLAVTIFAGVAFFHVQPANWSNFMPFGWYGVIDDGKKVGIFGGAAKVFFAYVGFDAVSTAVGESKNPQRDAPIGILASLAFCTVIYIIVAALLTAIVPYTALNVSSPASHALELIGSKTAAGVVATGVITGLTAVMLVLYYGLTRILLSMSGDGLLPKLFSSVNKNTHTPVKNTVICGIIMAIMAGLIPLDILADMVSIGTLAAFILVCGGVIVLRKTKPDMPRPFKMPFGITLPILGILSCGFLIYCESGFTQLRFIGWLVIGLVIYFLYSKKNSHAAE